MSNPFDLFGSEPVAPAPSAPPPVEAPTFEDGCRVVDASYEDEGIDLYSIAFGIAPKVDLPGITDEFLAEIYGGEIPEGYTKDGLVAQVTEYVNIKLAADGYCVIHGMPAWCYHLMGFVSSTLLKGYAKNPRTCKRPYQAKDDANTGSGIHAFSLQGQEGLDDECAIMPIECEGRGKPAIKAREAFALANPGKVPLPYRIGKDEDGDKPYIMDVLRGVDASLREHEIIGPLLANSQKEVSLFWINERHGVTIKARLDILCGYVLGDLKKCRDLDGFQWQIKDLRYDVQCGLYTIGAVACRLPVNPDTGIPNFALIPCEAFYPYRVAFWSRTPERLSGDIVEAERLIGLVKESMVTGNWPNFQIPYNCQSLADIDAESMVIEF